MRTEELMQNDWVRLVKVPIYCKVRTIYPDCLMGECGGGGHFEQKIGHFSPIVLTQDTILCTSFWLKKKNVFCKTVRGVASFTYELPDGRLTVTMQETGITNTHFIAFMHELQHLYLHYTHQELEVNMPYSKRKEYNKRYYGNKKEEGYEKK